MWSVVLCTLSLVYPLAAAHGAVTQDELERWRAYLVCFGLVVLPALVYPWWFPLRTEYVFLATLFLGNFYARGSH
jgi:hypothetical protein